MYKQTQHRYEKKMRRIKKKKFEYAVYVEKVNNMKFSENILS